MRLDGRLERDGRWWLAAVPVLDAMTQGRTKAGALAMVVDLLETMVDRPGFSARVHPGPGRTFEVSGSDVGAVVAVLLGRARSRSGRSLADVAKRLGQASRNAFGRYEQGRAVSAMEKLAELLGAVDCELVLRENSA